MNTKSNTQPISEVLKTVQTGDQFVKEHYPNSFYTVTGGMSVQTVVTVKEINRKLKTPRVIMDNGDKFTLDGIAATGTHGSIRQFKTGETEKDVRLHNAKRKAMIDEYEAKNAASAAKERLEAVKANEQNLEDIEARDTAVGELLIMNVVSRRGDVDFLTVKVETETAYDFTVKIGNNYSTYTKYRVGYTGWRKETMNSGKSYLMTTSNSSGGEGNSLRDALEDMIARIW